ncbi:MAG TPA: hypothetical protein VF103_09590 [Polyangiaceae bacterium]
MKQVALLTTWVLVALVALPLAGCESSAKKSALAARTHAVELAKLAREDAREIREGLPLGGKELEKLMGTEPLDAASARELLTKARDRVQDLRTAKSTFFALVGPDGVVVRNDQDQDRMAQKGLFSAFPDLKGALDRGYVEARGSMSEAAEVRGRPDAQRVAAVPVRVGGTARALYVTGWSWSAYAYRLQTSLRSSVGSARAENEKMPLIYAFVVVDGGVYGPRDAPDVNLRAISDAKVLDKAHGSEPFGAELDITGRPFGLGAVLVPELGEKTAIAVLRSET